MVHLVAMGAVFQDVRRWSHLPDAEVFGQHPRMRRGAQHSLPDLQHAGKLLYNKK